MVPAPVFIYALTCPLSGDSIRYVGKADNVSRRLRKHILRARMGERTHKANWIRKVLAAGLAPGLVILENVTPDNWREREVYWIAQHRGGGLLTNATDGGEGTSGYRHPPHIVAAVAEKNRGRRRSDECRRLISEANRGRSCSEESRRKISDRQAGRPLKPEHRAKIAAAMAAWDPSADARRRMSEATAGRPKSDDHRGKISRALAGRERSPEHCLRISQAKRGRSIGPPSEAHRQQLRNTHRSLRDPAAIDRAKAAIRLLADGVSGAEVARRLSISKQTVSAIRNGTLFRDLSRPWPVPGPRPRPGRRVVARLASAPKADPEPVGRR